MKKSLRPLAWALASWLAVLVLVPAAAQAQGTIIISGKALRVTPGDARAVEPLAQRLWMRYCRDAKLSRDDVKAIVRGLGLIGGAGFNQHLGFMEGDISFFHEQHAKGYVGVKRLIAELAARRLALQAADREELLIASQGDLSAGAQRLVPHMMQSLGACR
ncbi:hypothetical protein AAU61_01520 [Desulfocarbo indianensis]|nr:hypothetical protein AAU61_01520 [Desulfocarbo indianensis]